ncbi:glycosyltransferase family 2 protein [Dictyobacter arantiisoli]|uniref:Glycosyl hydrolase n=1 Tax=Dictyobacter arantiisoli TaxID=2014874 RepID=A0A5A5TFB2_9CHLR|nr:glycosyltransferase family 2 protein [Dictyobacter arantiisoli]GCF10261.1 glycosyl hydrolase [Dictyobacter arantiisoli]
MNSAIDSPKTHSIALVIPAWNEADALRQLLPEIPPHLVQWVVVVDNNSTDATAQVARAQGAVVVSELQRGYGRACWRGVQTASELGADLVVFMDGDGSDNPADLSRMLEPLLSEQADFVIGSRVGPQAEAGAVPPQARLGNWLISRMVSHLYGVHIHDIGSFRALRVEMLKALQMQEMTFGWPVEMLVKAARSRYRIVELPLRYRCRSHGHSKVSGTLWGSIRAANAMLSTMVRYARKRELRYV